VECFMFGVNGVKLTLKIPLAQVFVNQCAD